MWISPLALSEQLQKWKVFENRQMGLKRTNGFRSLQNGNTDASEANTNLSALGMEQSASFFLTARLGFAHVHTGWPLQVRALPSE